jgi:hypothetical protein
MNTTPQSVITTVVRPEQDSAPSPDHLIIDSRSNKEGKAFLLRTSLHLVSNEGVQLLVLTFLSRCLSNCSVR